MNAVESFPAGYPRYACLLSRDTAFQTFRGFIRTRMRLLLVKQNEIQQLEQKLDNIDTIEKRQIYLGCLQRDGNDERKRTLEELRQQLLTYGTSSQLDFLRTFACFALTNARLTDSMLADYCRVLSMPKGSVRDAKSLQSWLTGTGCISREEIAYLDHVDDLVNLTGTADVVFRWLENMIVDAALWTTGLFRMVSWSSGLPYLVCHLQHTAAS